MSCKIEGEVTIHPFAYLGEDVVIGRGVTLHPGVCVGDGCEIGDGCMLYPQVTLYPGVRLGKRVILHSGAVIGADGFGYVADGNEQIKIPQLGGVQVHDDVEIGANSCVDRASFGDTVLERGVKLDNHVHIGHNCHVGEKSLLCCGVVLGGGVKIGKLSFLGMGATIKNKIKIAEDTLVGQQANVVKDTRPHTVVAGPKQKPDLTQFVDSGEGDGKLGR